MVNTAAEIPIFVLGDQLWTSYSYNQSITLTLLSASGNIVSTPPVSPNSVVLLHRFADNDTTGRWGLLVHSASGTQLEGVQFEVLSVGGSSKPSIPRLTSSTVTQNGSLVLGFGEVANSANDLSACLLPGTHTVPANLKLPQQVGNYTLELEQQNGSLRANFFPTGGGTPPPFAMWVELRYTYSFTAPLNPHILISGEEQSAVTRPLVFSPPLSGRNISLPLSEQGRLRVGTYSVLVYFRNLAGLFLEETSVLLLNDGTWLWYGACSPQVRSSGNITAVVPLNSPGSWPSTIVVTYQVNGTEGYVEARVPTNLTSIYVATVPWGGQLPAGYAVGVTQNSNVTSVQNFNGSLYVQLRHTPTKFQTYVRFQGSDVATKTFNASGKYAELQWGVPLGRLQIAVQLDSNYAPGALVSVEDQAGKAAAGKTGATGTISFLLPPGRYTVVASLLNKSSTQQATVAGTQEGTLVFSFTTPIDYGPEYLLLGLAILGALANLWIWRGLLRRSSR
jgi:hypothetical protein